MLSVEYKFFYDNSSKGSFRIYVLIVLVTIITAYSIIDKFKGGGFLLVHCLKTQSIMVLEVMMVTIAVDGYEDRNARCCPIPWQK